jgi:thermitase
MPARKVGWIRRTRDEIREPVMNTKASAQSPATTVALFVALCVLVLPVATDDARGLETERFVPGQIIVKLAPKATIAQVNSRYGTQVQERFLDRKNTDIFLLRIDDGSSAPEKVAQITGSSLVRYVELNFLSGAPEVDDETGASARHRAFPAGNATPTTQNYSNNSSYPDSALNLTQAHKLSLGPDTTVAVLDTGAQLDHPTLKASFKGVPRYDFVDNDSDPSEPPLATSEEQLSQEVVGHGTHVAGIVHLAAPKAKLMPLRVLDREGYGSVFHVAEAIAFADGKGANVINLSLGTPSWSMLMREKVDAAIANGAVVVAAAGNYNSAQPQYPASNLVPPTAVAKDGLLAVTSVSSVEKKSDFANWGPWVDIAAPGEEILSAYPVSRYAYWSGTSMSTPFVAGEAALIQSVNGSLNPGGVEERIRLGARCVDEKNDPLYWHNLGAGHADVDASLRQAEGYRCILQVNP